MFVARDASVSAAIWGSQVLAGAAWWAPGALCGPQRGWASECYLATSRLSQSSECCMSIGHAISDCLQFVSEANTLYSVFDKYQTRSYKLLVDVGETSKMAAFRELWR